MLARQRLLSTPAFGALFWLAASLLFHFPLSPLWSLGRASSTPRLERSPPPALMAEIPVDTTDQRPGEAPAALARAPSPEPAAVPAPVEPTATPAEPTPPEPEASTPALPVPMPPGREREKKPALAEAGAPSVAKADAGAADSANLAVSDAGADLPDAGAGGSDPLAALGSVRTVNNTVSNVRLQIESDRLRAHPLGARVAGLLAEVNGWRDLLHSGGLDPAKNITRLLIAAPSLENSVGTVAIIEHNAGAEPVRALIDRLVSRDEQGAWLDGGAPRARAYAEGWPRLLVQPSEAVVVVALQRYLPGSSYSDPELGLRPLDATAVAFGQLEKPWRAARVLGLPIPRSIRWLRGRVELTPSGALIDVEAEAESPHFARRDADAFTRAASAANSASAERRIQSAAFEATGASIRGRILLTQAQALAWLEGLQAELARPPPAPGSSAAATDVAAETARPGGADPALDGEKPASVLGRPGIETDPP